MISEIYSAAGLTTHQFGFADMVKWHVARLFYPEIGRAEAVATMDALKNNDTALLTFWTEEEVQTEITVRQLLQHAGAEAGRDLFGQKFWVDQALPAMSKLGLSLAYRCDVVVIYDLRFANEAERVKQLGGEVWAIVRPGLASDGHATEVGVSDALVDRVIDNSGGLEDLRDLVMKVVGEL